jgi:hypothetical protein
MSRGRRFFAFEGESLSPREIRERFMPAFPLNFIMTCLQAGMTTRKEMLAHDAGTKARLKAGARQGRANSAKRRALGLQGKGPHQW